MKRYTPIILILVSIAAFFIFIDPQYTEVQLLQKEKESNNSRLSLSKELQDKRDRLHASFNNISASEKDHLRKLLPDTVDNVRLILDINNIAETYGITIRNILVQGGEESDVPSTEVIQSDLSNEIGIITLSFSMTATYDVFVAFLQDLEEALRIVDIRRLNIDKVGEGFMSFSVTLDTYWLR